MTSNRRTKVIDIQQLKAGMFVVKLDIPWVDSPFLKHTRLIKSEGEISKLRQCGVKKLVIDLSKGKAPESAGASGESLPTESKKSLTPLEVEVPSVSAQNKPLSKPQPENTLSATDALEKEMHKAVKIRSEIKNTLGRLSTDLENYHAVSLDALNPVIDATIESLERNNQALLNLVHLSRKSQKLVDHAFSTFCLSLNLAVNLALDDDARSALGMSALLHDSGWLQLPLHLMGKRSQYSGAEEKLVQSHLEIGLKLLSESQLPHLAVRIIREHHERCDGGGYPAGLTGDMIHRASKILAVVDSYDESVHQLKDKPGMLPTNALRQLYRDAQSNRFDGEIVAALINILGVYPVSSAVLLGSGEKAVVEQVFPNAHLEPIVRIVYDANHKLLKVPLIADLRQADNAHRKISSLLTPGDANDDPQRQLFPVYE